MGVMKQNVRKGTRYPVRPDRNDAKRQTVARWKGREQ